MIIFSVKQTGFIPIQPQLFRLSWEGIWRCSVLLLVLFPWNRYSTRFWYRCGNKIIKMTNTFTVSKIQINLEKSFTGIFFAADVIDTDIYFYQNLLTLISAQQNSIQSTFKQTNGSTHSVHIWFPHIFSKFLYYFTNEKWNICLSPFSPDWKSDFQ